MPVPIPPTPPGPPLLEVELAVDPTSAGAARSAVTPVLAERLDPDALDRLVLLVSELVTNVVRHARTSAELRIWVADQFVLVKACDGSPIRPQLRPQAPDALNGRGMHLVDQLTTRWGIEPTDTGKCVWFELHNRPDPEARDGYVHFDMDAVDPL